MSVGNFLVVVVLLSCCCCVVVLLYYCVVLLFGCFCFVLPLVLKLKFIDFRKAKGFYVTQHYSLECGVRNLKYG